MNGNYSYILTKETKDRVNAYHGLGKIHAVLIGMTCMPSMKDLFPDWYPVHIMPTGDTYTFGWLKQIIYN